MTLEEENAKQQEKRFSEELGVDAEALANKIQRERIDKAVAFVGGPKLRVLDGGCATGAISELIHANGNEVWGMDFPAVVSQMPEERLKWIHPVPGDIGKKPWPFEDGFFDILFFGEIVEHFLDIAPFFEEAHRVLKPRGRLVLTTPNATRGINRVGMLFGQLHPWHEWEHIPHHVRYWTRKTLVEALRKYGFEPKRWEWGTSQAEGVGAINGLGFDESWFSREPVVTPMERQILLSLMRKVMRGGEEHSFIIVEAIRV